MDDFRENLPALKINKQYINNTKLARILSTKEDILVQADDILQFEITIKENIFNLVDLWSDSNITLSQRVDQFDMAIMDAVYTMFKNGAGIITLESIGRVMSGNERKKITPNQLDKIRKSVDKLRSIHIKIDCTDEINKRKGKKELSKFTYESYLLPLGKVEAKYVANGKEITAYPILECPALYRYAEMVNQIIDVPKILLETQDYFNDTDEAILVKRYVIKRVAQIINNNKLKSNKLSFLWYENNGEIRGMYSELGYVPEATIAWRKKKSKIHKIVKDTLEYLKNTGIIEDYTAYRNHNSNDPSEQIMGFIISCSKNNNLSV